MVFFQSNFCSSVREMKSPWADSGVRELVALSFLAAFGCGLAWAHDDLIFVAVFGGASAMTIVEAIRRLL